MGLTKEQHPQIYLDFLRDGYCVIPNIFNKEELKNISEEMDQLEKTAKKQKNTIQIDGSLFVIENDAIQRVVWCSGNRPKLQTFSRHSVILATVENILCSSEFDQIICQTHFKLPGDNVEFEWHQDSQHRYFGTEYWTDINTQGSFVQTLIAVDEMNLQNGPIEFIKGSHKLGHIDLPNNPNWEDQCKNFEREKLCMNPGDVAFFHPYVIHGSTSNHSPLKRRVLINGFAYPGANRFEYPGCGLGVRIST